MSQTTKRTLLFVCLTAFLLLAFPMLSANITFAETSAGEADQAFTEAQAAYDRGDYTSAFSKWRELGDRGNAQAQYHVGRMILRAQGADYDTREATKWLERAAKGGFAPGQIDLARLYSSGQGVLKDEKKAIFWYEAAVAQGNTVAMLELARIYRGKNGLRAHEEKATALVRSAAELGDVDAQFELGLHYSIGLGIEQDDYKSYVWQTIGALKLSRSNFKEALEKLRMRDAFARSLPFDRRQAAEAEALKWLNEHVSP
jgi:TPR repeat protein